MAHSIPLPLSTAGSAARSYAASTRIPWYVWCFFVSTASAVIGAIWDISWHMSIGRDTLWSPPHLFIYASGLLGGFTAAWLILHTTWHRASPLREVSIRMWGFCGPLGAFLAAWGALAMITSAPFDDWWHNAYGLDTKILSPPHMVLAFGLLGIRFGALFVAVGEMNRASGDLRNRLTWVVLFIGAMVLGIAVGTFLELTTRNFMHSARFYVVLGCSVPVVLAAIREATGHRWGATVVAFILFCLQLGLLWVLPLFPAEPKLGPVYREVTHFIPNPFPIWLVIPAILLDLLRRRMPESVWKYCLAAGPVFVGVLLAVQWPFADFLNSPAARNRIFGADYLPFFTAPATDLARSLYTAVETSSTQFALRLALAVGCATISTRLGLGWGRWMRRLRR